ncbi:DUF4229 domain-containing protein [Longivirga aurantiaca]|uniref:DUF4229 domain-containing protein n=1 Tax=Longivirga aurantiaca TaxID=1837743 RepID=A0ABW1SXH8_9ACTN
MSQDDATSPAPDTAAAPRGAHPVLVYTGLRLLLLAVTAGVLWLIGLREPLILLVFAFLISGVISVFALNRRREVAAVEVVTAVQKVNQRIEESASSEDTLEDDLADLGPDPAAGRPDGSGRAGAFPGANAAPAAPAPKPSKREIPADDDLDDLEPTDRP